MKMNTEKIENLWKELLKEIGEDTDREGLKDTPKRVAKMYKEIFKGYKKEEKPKVTVFNNGRDGVIYDQMIIDTGKFYSQCEHHCKDFWGSYKFGYIASTRGKILGLSKVARVVEYFSSKLQIQERLGQEIVDYLWSKLSENCLEYEKPLGMILVLEGKHMCKCSRGVKNDGYMVTSTIKGTFKNPEVRQEFLSLVGGIKKNG